MKKHMIVLFIAPFTLISKINSPLKVETKAFLPLCISSVLHCKGFNKHSYPSFQKHKSDATNPAGKKLAKAPWLLFIYAAARNDLEQFFWRNLEKMQKVGSNENCIIVVHLDLYRKRGKRITKRLLVEKGHVEQIGPDLSMDSGDENTVITELRWANDNFDFEKLGVVFWNHGSGDVNPLMGKIFNPSHLFHYNPDTNLLELDRNINLLEIIDHILGNFPSFDEEDNQRGVCFDDSTGNYLDDGKLIRALNTFCMQDRKGKRINVVFFDACLMAGIGTQCIFHNFADYMVASEEVELGIGYPYDLFLAPFRKKDLEPEEFAKHAVYAYKEYFNRLTEDYTHSCIDLSKFPLLNDNINRVSLLLIKALQNQRNGSATTYLRNCYKATTHFEEKSYVDVDDLWAQLLNNLPTLHLLQNSETAHLIQDLKELLEKGRQIISQTVMANAVGKNLSRARGISIYFPQNSVYPSYHDTQFAKTNQWYNFLRYYVK